MTQIAAPVPTAEEAAAIAAAIEALWPRPAAVDHRSAGATAVVEVQRPVVEPADPAPARPSLDLTSGEPGRRWMLPPGVALELTTVTTDSATFHDGASAVVVAGLEPASTYEHAGIAFTTLPQPGRPAALPLRHRQRRALRRGGGRADRRQRPRSDQAGAAGQPAVPRGDEPRRRRRDARRRTRGAAGRGVRQGRPDRRRSTRRVRRVRGLLPDGLRSPGSTSCAATTTASGVSTDYAGDKWIELPGVDVALLDTCVPHEPGGDLGGDQIDWLDAARGGGDRPGRRHGPPPAVVHRFDRRPRLRPLRPGQPGARRAVHATARRRRLHRRPRPSPPRADGRRPACRASTSAA